MSAVEPFSFDGQPVRVVMTDGEPYFVAADVARILGYRMASDMTRRLDPEDRGTRLVRTPGGEQEMSVISEPGLYVAVLGSEVSGAREFKRWVVRDVLPAIRRTGIFGVERRALPQNYREALRELLAEVEGREAAEARVAELEPQAAAAKAVMSADGDWSVREAAQVLSRDPAITTGQRRLFGTLRELGWVDRRGIPYQRHIEVGRLTTRVRTYDHPHTGEPTLGAPQIRVTGRGLVDLHKHLRGEAAVESLVADHEGVPA